ncbi:hypothetical protein LPJ66_007137 [Kickxella alabastrina]|uniref:Uncharacterized protein n=1 Tax=Kickxella alabastrina TaxID=61397 RepID=A0ACC1IAC0_9FUNG|nr:hypothetical protein LPJ66_007137 [Kickxella alabastrina]
MATQSAASSETTPELTLTTVTKQSKTKQQQQQRTTNKPARLSKDAQSRKLKVIKESVRTKAQYENLTLRWQEKLLDPTSEAQLKQASRYLTPDDFESVIEERTSDNLCGYPLCGNKPRKSVQRYHISLAKRKVYDQEELRSYCSDRCMVGSRFYKQQLSEEPIYMRDRSSKVDIEVMPLNLEELVPKAAVARIVKDAGAANVDKSLIDWYRESLLAKMRITKAVADANPLQIIEHESGPAIFDIDERLGKMQFADIDGFAPEADSVRIKKDIERVRRLEKEAAAAAKLKAEARAARADKTDGKGDDSEVLVIVPKDRDVDPQKILQPFDSASEDDYDDDEDEDEDDHNDNFGGLDFKVATVAPSKDKGHFSSVFGNGNGKGAPPLSLFGRMWTLVDCISTEMTQKYLHDLKLAYADGEPQRINATEYFISPGDQSMSMRHNILLNGIMSQLDIIGSKVGIKRFPRNEVRVLVSTLELGSSMAVFKRPEAQLLCISFIFALASSMDDLGDLVLPGGSGDVAALRALDEMLEDLGTDASSLRMISRRFCEPY